jgi:hypothetical protein
MLDLSRCTLLFVETRAHKITKRVIADCLSKANFGDVLIYTDKMEEFIAPELSGIRLSPVPDFPNKKEAGQFYYQYACAGIHTDFALMLEWDAGIYDPSKWKPEFFDYDYIGAPWTVRPQERDCLDVGNGGFTLMSKRLGQYLAEHPKQHPVCTDWDLCRNQRKGLEAAGFKWPGRTLATHFSWELGERNPENFGFHGAFRWIDMLERDELVIRAKLLTETPYLRSKMHDIFRYSSADWLEKEIGAEAVARYREANPTVFQGNVIRPNHRVNMMRLLAERQAAAYQSRGLKA